jgi:pimeloyl-[acyl-carrier protein] methyl ester esterase
MSTQKEKSAIHTRTDASSQWVLIRGLAREARHWGHFPADLKKSLEALSGGPVRIDTLDLPGTGRFSEMKSPISINQITDFVRDKFIEHRTRLRQSGEVMPRETFLVSISLGGMVASRWLERWPDDFNGAVLINTSFKTVSPFYQRLKPQSYLHLFDIARRTNALERERAVLKLVSNRPDLFDQSAKEWAHIHLTRPVTYENFARQIVAAARFKSVLETPPVPVLLLNSLSDRMVSPSCSKEIADKWHAELKRHPTAGHDLAHDDAPWVTAQISDWWKRLHI